MQPSASARERAATRRGEARQRRGRRQPLRYAAAATVATRQRHGGAEERPDGKAARWAMTSVPSTARTGPAEQDHAGNERPPAAHPALRAGASVRARKTQTWPRARRTPRSRRRPSGDRALRSRPSRILASGGTADDEQPGGASAHLPCRPGIRTTSRRADSPRGAARPGEASARSTPATTAPPARAPHQAPRHRNASRRAMPWESAAATPSSTST